ncbi:glycosyltransferase [Oceanobacter mangrovi]|uniref:glycosyltransferase n=1 Tax=Oceanobacter mangrovi TaxID=2862510 RepID=UPI001C8D7DA3|nr:glycosyltransferase [Oceanobacter mangrovi]
MIGWILLYFSIVAIAAVFVGYPLFLWLYRQRLPKRADIVDLPDSGLPRLSVLIAVRNGEHLIEQKVRNCLELDYPHDKLEVVVVSDGSNDGTMAVLKSIDSPQLHAWELSEHKGKHEALNTGMPHCRGDVVLFTDADAMLEPQAARKLARHFADPRIGGVGGQRLIGDVSGQLQSAQSTYIDADSKVKMLESAWGSVTSNDGKIYAIRRSLFQGVAAAVTDDLYVCLTVLAQGWKFRFEPEAKAYIRTPSRDSGHELSRRRRIVNRSLRGIWLNRVVLNPARTSWQIAVGLFINKVMRRLLPVFLLLLLLSSAALCWQQPWLLLLLLPQLGIYGAALLHWLLDGKKLPLGPLNKILSVSFYFALGNLGTLLGMMDFLSGHQPIRWEPKKSG